MKLIVTHKSVDLDAVTSTWLIKRFYPHFKEASIVHVNAGSTWQDVLVDSDTNIIHVDTGLGRFDHHQNNDFTCASQKVYEWLIVNTELKPHMQQGLERMITFVTKIDHFREVDFPDPTSDIYEFSFFQLVEGLKHITGSDERAVEVSFIMLDAILQLMTNKIRAEKDIKEGLTFTSSFGKSLALESRNEEAIKLALKMGYQLVVRKDPVKGNIRIKTFPSPQHNLQNIYEKILQKDTVGSWFLHASGKMLLNGSSKNPALKPTNLTLHSVIEIIKSITNN
jgi:hypothetical protein